MGMESGSSGAGSEAGLAPEGGPESVPDADGGCPGETPTLCLITQLTPLACVDPMRDPQNCGACGAACSPHVACVSGVCADSKVRVLVPPAPGCLSMRVVAEGGRIYWSDLGHGLIQSVEAPGTVPSSASVAVASAKIAALVLYNHPANTYPGPIATPLLVRGTTAYFVETNEPFTTDEAGSGAAGTSIVSVQPGIATKTLFTASDGEPINAMALSPDGATLYFSDGGNIFMMPSAGMATAGDLKSLGYHYDVPVPFEVLPTAMATDGRYLAFMESGSYQVGVVDTSTACADASSAACALGLVAGRLELLDKA